MTVLKELLLSEMTLVDLVKRENNKNLVDIKRQGGPTRATIAAVYDLRTWIKLLNDLKLYRSDSTPNKAYDPKTNVLRGEWSKNSGEGWLAEDLTLESLIGGFSGAGSNKSDVESLKAELFKIAKDFWAKKGAKFGERQKISEIDVSANLLPRSFDETTEFVTKHAVIEPGAGNGHDIGCSLWISKIKKDGSEASEIRLATIILSKYNMKL